MSDQVVAITLYLTLPLFLFLRTSYAQADEFISAGSLATARYYHTATLLPSHKVLVVGGIGTDYFASTELYDPVTNAWSIAGSLATGRFTHTATLLPSGKVLVTGGYTSVPLDSTELYDPTTNG